MKHAKKTPARKATKAAPKKGETTKSGAPKDGASAAPSTPKAPRAAKPPRERDPRLPRAGTVLQRAWHKKVYEITIGESHFACGGQVYASLSALAREITGAKSINGFLWAGLTKRAEPTAKGAGTPVTRVTTEKRRASKVATPTPDTKATTESK